MRRLLLLILVAGFVSSLTENEQQVLFVNATQRALSQHFGAPIDFRSVSYNAYSNQYDADYADLMYTFHILPARQSIGAYSVSKKINGIELWMRMRGLWNPQPSKTAYDAGFYCPVSNYTEFGLEYHLEQGNLTDVEEFGNILTNACLEFILSLTQSPSPTPSPTPTPTPTAVPSPSPSPSPIASPTIIPTPTSTVVPSPSPSPSAAPVVSQEQPQTRWKLIVPFDLQTAALVAVVLLLPLAYVFMKRNFHHDAQRKSTALGYYRNMAGFLSQDGTKRKKFVQKKL
ncbi:Uncharacterised protein [Candidatus Norongarragalina meridionalis]|nr:Uncharacterised protein [Candidatus Norongarragalina meridionalis]